MEKELIEVKEKVQEALTKMDIIVDSVTFDSEGKYNFLRIVLDKISGLDLDTIVDATNIINPIIDKYTFINDSYILDVISKEKGDV